MNKIKKLLMIFTTAITNIEMIICCASLISNCQSGNISSSRCVVGICIAIQILLFPYLLLISDLIHEKNYRKALEKLSLTDVPSPFNFKWYLTIIILATMTMCMVL